MFLEILNSNAINQFSHILGIIIITLIHMEKLSAHMDSGEGRHKNRAWTQPAAAAPEASPGWRQSPAQAADSCRSNLQEVRLETIIL